MKRAILFIGLPGAGKTTHIENNLSKKFTGYQIVSADEIKYQHPEYNPFNPERTHQWSVKEAERLMDEYSNLGIDICMDSGGVNKSYSLRIINMLKSKGYHIELIHMDTPVDVCILRNRLRGRLVPENVIIDKSEKIDDCVIKQKQISDIYTQIKYIQK